MNAHEMHQLVAAVASGLAVAVFVYAGLDLFRRGWAGYEEKYIAGAEQTLDAMYLTMPAQHLVYLSVLCAAILGLVLMLLTGNAALAFPLGALGLGVPMVALKILKRQRDAKFNEQLVDSLMSISNSLKAGFTLPQAFEVLANEMPNPMRQEMRLMTQELRLGVSLEDALDHLYQRMPSGDLDLVVTSIQIVRGIGGNLTEVFDNIAATIRERMRIEGRISALTAQGRAQAMVMMMLPIAVGVGMHVMTPGSMDPLFSTAGGAVILGAGVVLMLVAGLLIRKIVTIDV